MKCLSLIQSTLKLNKMEKTIPQRYFEVLKNTGHTVARYDKTGEVIPFKVGKEYTIINEGNKKRKC